MSHVRPRVGVADPAAADDADPQPVAGAVRHRAGHRANPLRVASRWACRASRITSKVWDCGQAVSVRWPDVVHEVGVVGQLDVGAVDALRAGAVDDEQVVTARAAGDVDVLAELDVALGAEDDQPSVAPGGQPLRGVPVDADVAVGVVAAQRRLAEVLHGRRLGMGVVGHRAGHHLGGLGAGEPQELVDLVAGDVGEDAAGAGRVVEPVGPTCAAGQVGAVAFPVRTQSQGLDDLADPPGADQLAGPDRAAHLEPLGEGDRPEPPGLGHRPLELGELVEGDAPRLVGHDVLAVTQRLDGDRTAAVRHRCGDDQVDRRVLQQLAAVGDPRGVRPAGPGGLGHRGVRVVGAQPDELAALTQQTLGLPEGVGVVQADDGEP